MVLEEYLKIGTIENRPYLAFVMGAVFTALGFLITLIFFRSSMSVSMIFLTTLFLVPMLIKLVKQEEARERREGLKHFFHNHKDIFEVYLFSFLGIFIAFVALGFATHATDQQLYQDTFSFQTEFLRIQHGVEQKTVTDFVKTETEPTMMQFFSIISKNAIVLFLCFALAFFYGASAIFLIILNASVFANFIVLAGTYITQTIGQKIMLLGFFLVHLLPEISGFLLAAIAGGVVSKAIIKEKYGSQEFRNVFKDATILLLIATGMMVLAAILETFVTTRLFSAFF
jgi:uncharacterized membrane protein SpoIIM required for sporulation